MVFADANLDAVIDTVRTMGFWNAGQECGAATRVLCASSIHDELVDKLTAAVASLVVGAPDEGDAVEIGPLISARQLEKVDDFVRDAVFSGACVTTGGSRDSSRPGYFFSPTVIANLPDTARAARQEIFGPVVTVQKFENEDEANLDFG